MLTIDTLAQEIRRVDGSHSLGAGALAEALMPFISAALSEQSLPVRVKELEWKGAEGGNICLIATARTPFGSYFIESDVEGFVLMFNSIGLLPHPTFSAAKAAAQQDYETRIRSSLVDNSHASEEVVERKYGIGDRVTKKAGSSWTGHVVGFYSTALTPIGYAVESENEPGSVQIYPEAALSSLRPAEVGSATDTTGTSPNGGRHG